MNIIQDYLKNDIDHSNRNKNNDFIVLKEEIKKNKKYSIEENKLNSYNWGIGLEHEVHFFHMVKMKDLKNKISFNIFDSMKSSYELVLNSEKYPELTLKQKLFLENIPFELSGRVCSGKLVLPRVPVNMAEFISGKHLSTQNNKKTMEYYCENIITNENLFKSVQKYNTKTKKLINKYGEIKTFPFGMSNYIKKDKTMYEDYTGSYHVTITLPFDINKITDKDYNKKFIKIHQNFANQIQWIEPLLIVAFFSADLKCMGTAEKKIKGSYRVMRVGWGNFAGSDVRKFQNGIGRYSNIKSHWRKGLNFKDIEKLKLCYNNNENNNTKNNTKKNNTKNSNSALSSNFRTFGMTDLSKPWHKESGTPMNIPNGIEIRIFDHFSTTYLIDLCRLIVYIAENSIKHQTKNYVYNNKYWIECIQNIMTNGWVAEISEKYVKEINKNLDLDIDVKSYNANDLFNIMNEKIYNKNKNGDIVKLMLTNPIIPKNPEINKNSWNFGFAIKLYDNPLLYKKFIKLIKLIDNKPVNIFNNTFYNIFNIDLWENDIINIYHFFIKFNIIIINNNIFNINITKFNIKKIIYHYLNYETINYSEKIKKNMINILAEEYNLNNL